MRVIGTAGHVDHGKSTLVRALTGIDPDRLQEEKARGMTIDLGFAWMQLPAPAGAAGETGESVGIVDVPGHIDFIKNMLAGVGGIDAALLVIAADEGAMPQTREHLAILDLLHAPTAVVALTKIDLIDDPEWLELLELEVAGLLQGTALAGAPIVRVSAATGAGLDELRAALAAQLAGLPTRRDWGKPRLPVDRAFALPGFGVVVTGTLLDGALEVGARVEILPAGLPARVRGLQRHRQPLQRAEPGSRVAINLSGVELQQLRRGDVVALPGALVPSTLLDVELRVLPGAPALHHNHAVDLFVGASESPAHVRLIGVEALQPGQSGWVQLRLARPVAAAVGDRLILRLPSPSATVAGGRILHTAPGRRWRRFAPATLSRFATLARGAPDALLLDALLDAPLQSPRQLAGQLPLEEELFVAALAELLQKGELRALPAPGEPLLLAEATWQRLLGTLRATVTAYHETWPLRAGMPRAELRSPLAPILRGARGDATQPTPRTLALLLEAAAAEGTVAVDESSVRLAGFAPEPTPLQQEALARTLAAFATAPSAPPNLPDTLALLGGDAELLDWLLAQRVLVRLGADVLLRREDAEAMMERVVEALRSRGSLTLAEARDLLGSSRKYVQPLLEEMDQRRITRRDGEARVLR